ncbi:MAG: hypothetical protein CMJ75_19165 [Planctomycetaceae bacterium]|nr:hypothetical protein [Planctomycetaceae bacterium]
MLGIRRKPDESRMDYDVDFARLIPADDRVISMETRADEGIELASSQLFGNVVKVWLAGGTARKTYTVTVLATTQQGRIVEECFKIRVTEC